MVFPKGKGGSREWERREERKRWETAGRATIGSPSFNSINQIRGKCKAEAKLVPEGEKRLAKERRGIGQVLIPIAKMALTRTTA